MASTDDLIKQAQNAASAFRKLDQSQTDRIVRAVYLTAMENRVRLAKMAAEETSLGVWQHKVIKNVITSQLVYEHIKNQKTVGVISEDSFSGILTTNH